MDAAINWEEIPFAQKQRLRFIESALIWEGSIQRKRVCDVFRVNVNHVTKDYHLYKAHFPKSLEYNPSARAYEPGINFKPVLATGDPSEYLTLLLAYAQSQSQVMLPLVGANVLRAESIPKPGVMVDREVLQQVLQATRLGRGVRVKYHSMSSAREVTRTLWPHSLVHTGDQWHVRAYDDERNAFRNFAISRISNLVPAETDPPVPVEADVQWHTLERAEVIPHPGLNEHQKAVVAREFGMRRLAGELAWMPEIRQCLIGYFVTAYGLDNPTGDPLKDRIVLRNHEALKAFFFASS